MPAIIKYALVKTKRRLTFDIAYQRPDTRYQGEDDGDYWTFRASNGYEVISRSRMDIQTERLWLLGASADERSGSMVFSSDEKRDKAYDAFALALAEWQAHVHAGAWGTSLCSQCARSKRARCIDAQALVATPERTTI